MALNKFWKKSKRWVPGFVISAIAIIILLNVVELEDVASAVKMINIKFILIAVALTIVSLFTKSLVWRSILNLDVSLKDTFFIICQGYLLNNILPLKAGEVGRAVLMNQKTGKGVMYMFSSIVIERAIDIGFAAGLFLVTLPLTTQMESAKPFAIMALSAVLAGFIVLYFVARFHRQISNFIEKYLLRWQWGYRVIFPRIQSFLDGFQVITRPAQFLKALFWSAVTWTTWVMLYYLVLRAIAPDAPFWWGAFINGLLALGAAVPSAPAGLGVYEASMVGALSILQVDRSLSMAYAITMHFIQIVITGIFGAIGFMRNKISISSLLRYKDEGEKPQKDRNEEVVRSEI
ncbi:MAG: flippase-like domain-containing protein [Anaerolineaceae bacterium]|nr:flippase-like domain-containing protein [Anaerolineaceae bacterium]